jgi:hypothetical protein
MTLHEAPDIKVTKLSRKHDDLGLNSIYVGFRCFTGYKITRNSKKKGCIFQLFQFFEDKIEEFDAKTTYRLKVIFA